MGFIDAFTKRKNSLITIPSAGQKMHVYKLDSYTELHNKQCQSQRRELFVAVAGSTIGRVVWSSVIRPVLIISALGSTGGAATGSAVGTATQVIGTQTDSSFLSQISQETQTLVNTVDTGVGTSNVDPLDIGSAPSPVTIGSGSRPSVCVSVICIRRRMLEMAQAAREKDEVLVSKKI